MVFGSVQKVISSYVLVICDFSGSHSGMIEDSGCMEYDATLLAE